MPLRADPAEPAGPIDATILTEDGGALAFRAEPGEAGRIALADGRTILERLIALPDLPVGRHRLIVDGVECALVVAPSEAHLAKAALRRRFGVSAQLYALKRNGDQGIGDFTTLGRAGALAGEAGAAFFGVSPLHHLFPRDRERASPYHPSDRRFLDPILIDALDPCGLPDDDISAAALAALGDQIEAASSAPGVEYSPAWAIKREALAARYAAFARARAARPDDPIFADYDRFVAAGGEALRRFAIFEAIAARRGGEDWRRWPAPLRDGERDALAAAATEESEAVAFALFSQWLADRQLAAAAERAKAGGLEIGFYRDLAVGAAPDGAENWARAEELARNVTVGAPPDPFSTQGQIWNLPPPDPLASARDGWRGFSALDRREHALRRHAAHRPRDGPDAAVRHSVGRQTGRGRLSRLSGRRPARPRRAREPARAMRRRRRGPRHRAAGLQREAETLRHSRHARVVVRAARRAVHAAQGLSRPVDRLRHDPRPADARRLVVGRRRRRAFGARR